MTNFLMKLKRLSIITIIASVIIGIVLIVKPDTALQTVSIICGVTVILLGIGSWIYYFAKDNSVFMAVMGTLALIAGIVICAKYRTIISFFLVIFGIFLIVSGVIDFISALDARHTGVGGWLVSLIMSFAIVILGVTVTINPFDSMIFVTRLLGVSLIAYAVMDLAAYFQVKKAFGLKTVVDSDVAEVDVSPDDIENADE